jgi:hypothetical protein
MVRAGAQRPVGTGLTVAINTFLPVALLTFWNLRTKEQRAAYKDIADHEKEGNFLFIPPTPQKTDKGWKVIKMPISQGTASLATIVRRSIEAMYEMVP